MQVIRKDIIVLVEYTRFYHITSEGGRTTHHVTYHACQLTQHAARRVDKIASSQSAAVSRRLSTMLGSELSIYAFRRHEPCCLALVGASLVGENMMDDAGSSTLWWRCPADGARAGGRSSGFCMPRAVRSFLSSPFFWRFLRSSASRLLALSLFWALFTGNRGAVGTNLLRCCFCPFIPTNTSLRDTPIPTTTPTQHTQHTQPTQRVSATTPAVPPSALPAARRNPVTIWSICAFLSVPILSYFFLAPSGSTTTLSYITYTESSAPPLRLHLLKFSSTKKSYFPLNSLYIQKTTDRVLTMSMFSQFSFRPLDEVPKPRIHTDSDYNSPTPSTDIDSPAKFDDSYDSDEFLEHHSSPSSLSLSRSWSRPSRRDKIPEEDEENEGDVSPVLCYVLLVL